MATKCARCIKTVYKAEELKCLDKSWHKSCFKCSECNMTLTLRTYKGFNKEPYCNAHYPQLKATSVESNPEMDRQRNNTRMNSMVAYQKDYRENMVGAGMSLPENIGVPQRGLANIMGGRSADYEDENYPSSPTQPPMPSGGGGGGGGDTYCALYDYEAADSDEVSFRENDTIVDCEVVDEGWVMGTVQSTGQRGMIPFNYIEQM